MSDLVRAVSPSRAPVLIAPDHWCAIDFISDLHLNANEPATMLAWRQYMQSTGADAVFILGDLFDVWVGDDVLTTPPGDVTGSFAFDRQCAQIMRDAAHRLALFVMHGNRDFLMGQGFAKASGATLVTDPTLLVFAGERCLLSHGDAWCLDDADYMRFRALVRGADWQRSFLERPLGERQAIGKDLRSQSEAKKRQSSHYVDLRTSAVLEGMHANQSHTLIHGHTHRPAVHPLGEGRRRVVLSDWDAGGAPPRTEVVRLRRESRQGNALSLQRIDAAQAGNR